MGKTFTDPEEQTIAQAYRDGNNVSQIARALGVTWQIVHRVLKRQQIKIRPQPKAFRQTKAGTQRKCAHCGLWKNLNHYHKNKNLAGGVTTTCKTCRQKTPQTTHKNQNTHETNQTA